MAIVEELLSKAEALDMNRPIDRVHNVSVYQQEWNGDSRLGFVCSISAESICRGKTLPHEQTLSGKVTALTKALEVENDKLPPILLVYKHRDDLQDYLSELREDALESHVFDAHDMKETMYLLNQKTQAELQTTLLDVGNFLIADGHHRVSAAETIYRTTGRNLNVRAVCISDRDAYLRSFIKIVRCGSATRDELLQSLRAAFPQLDDRNFADSRCFSVRAGAEWHRFCLGDTRLGGTWQAFSSRLNAVLERFDCEISHYLPPDSSDEEIDSLIATAEMEGIACRFPVIDTAELWAYASRGKTLEPHSTYFEAKPQLR